MKKNLKNVTIFFAHFFIACVNYVINLVYVLNLLFIFCLSLIISMSICLSKVISLYLCRLLSLLPSLFLCPLAWLPPSFKLDVSVLYILFCNCIVTAHDNKTLCISITVIEGVWIYPTLSSFLLEARSLRLPRYLTDGQIVVWQMCVTDFAKWKECVE